MNVIIHGLAALAISAGGTALLLPAEKAPQSQISGEPERIQVQHILIAFQGTLPGKAIVRSPEEARKLAYEILARARAGEAFDALVKQHTDDQFPGIYGMSNRGVRPEQGEFPREQMVSAFGDVGFKLKPGEIGIADHDPKASPFGYHIIKRVR